MSDRRRFPRYALLRPAVGRARIVSDCVVETHDGNRLVLLAPHAVPHGETYQLQLSSALGTVTTHEVRVVSSTPVADNGVLRFRLHVSVGTAVAAAPEHEAPASALQTTES